MRKIGIIGCGNMGKALAVGIAKGSRGEFSLGLFDKKKAKALSAKKFLGKKVKVFSSLTALFAWSDILLFAVKPQDISEVLINLNNDSRKLFISIAAGISTKFVEKKLPGAKVIRVMPNLAAKVGKSISALAKGRQAKKSDLKTAEKIFSFIGTTLVVDEKKIDAVTAISGSGPGYIFYLLSLITKAALKVGFSQKEAELLTKEMFLGSAEIIKQQKGSFCELYRQVASRGGTTEAAVSFWQAEKMEKVILSGIKKALKRAKELSKK